MKPDERALAAALLVAHGGPDGHLRRQDIALADAIGARVGLHHKRVLYILEKWMGRDWWDYGVTCRSGWFTPAGWERLTAALNARQKGSIDADP